MRWTHVLAVGAATSIGLVAACSAPAGNTGTSTANSTQGSGKIDTAAAALDPNAKGPAPTDPAAKKGGTLTIAYATAPSSMDPSAQFYQDSGAIMARLTMRSLTQFVQRDGKQVLVPDLATDLGQVSSDGLTWTFKLRPGIKYSDGSVVTAKDVAYAVKRSFAFTETGPTYQVDFLKGGKNYKGPFKPGGESFNGVEAPDDSTVVFHLEKQWETLPYFTTFSQVSPIPQAKDTKDESYGDKALATGPYMIQSFTQGSELKLVKNPNWDASTDAARTQYVDGYDFKFGVDSVKTQTAILASNGPDATTLNWDGIDSSLLDQVTGAKSKQFVSGPSSCTVTVNLDTRKMPIEVRKALAVAYPWDDINKAAGATDVSQTPAHTLIPPQIPGWVDFTLPGLDGKGNGDAAKAKEMLKAAGKENFELSYYYTNDDPSNVAQTVNQIRKTKLTAAGFTVKDLGVPNKERRKLIAKPDAPTNMGQSPAGWCFDWPSADSIFPPTVSSTQIKSGGTNWGNLSDPKLDAEMERIQKLSIKDQGPEWGKFDKMLMTDYLPALPWYWDKGNYTFGTKVHNVLNDANHGLPMIDNIWLDQ